MKRLGNCCRANKFRKTLTLAKSECMLQGLKRSCRKSVKKPYHTDKIQTINTVSETHLPRRSPAHTKCDPPMHVNAGPRQPRLPALLYRASPCCIFHKRKPRPSAREEITTRFTAILVSLGRNRHISEVRLHRTVPKRRANVTFPAGLRAGHRRPGKEIFPLDPR